MSDLLDYSTIRAYQTRLFNCEACMSYLEERKVGMDALDRYGVGYFDVSRYSKLYDRIVFPVRDQYNGLHAYQGRAMWPGPYDSENPKYYHGKFDKGHVIYGLYEAAEQLVDFPFVVLVEGPFDVMALYQAGIPAVALLGTSMSVYQALVLRRYTKEIRLWLDNDKAGAAATKSVASMIKKADLNLTAVRQQEGAKDPADTWMAGGIDAIREVVYSV